MLTGPAGGGIAAWLELCTLWATFGYCAFLGARKAWRRFFPLPRYVHIRTVGLRKR